MNLSAHGVCIKEDFDRAFKPLLGKEIVDLDWVGVLLVYALVVVSIWGVLGSDDNNDAFCGLDFGLYGIQ